MLTKADLEALAETRLQDAIFLLGRSSSAYYLAGYAVEFALKACIAKAFQPNAIPDKAFVIEIHTHTLEKLLGTAGLLPPFSTDSKLILNLQQHGVSQASGKSRVGICYGTVSPLVVLFRPLETLSTEYFNG